MNFLKLKVSSTKPARDRYLFAFQQTYTALSGITLLREYLQLVIQYPVPHRMVKGHVHKLIGPWLSEYHDLRDKVNCGGLDVKVVRAQIHQQSKFMYDGMFNLAHHIIISKASSGIEWNHIWHYPLRDCLTRLLRCWTSGSWNPDGSRLFPSSLSEHRSGWIWKQPDRSVSRALPCNLNLNTYRSPLLPNLIGCH